MSKSNTPNRPTHAVYVVESEGHSAYWTKIGSVWSHSDGDGFNVQPCPCPAAS